MTPTEGRERGEKRAGRSINRAAYFHEPQIRRDTLRFLDALLSSATGCATLDDATPDLKAKHADGGKWRGAVVKRLRAAGIIVAVGYVRSCRLHRNAGPSVEWRLIDRDGAVRLRAVLAAQLQKDAGESAVTDSPAVDSKTHTPNGETNNGQAQ